MIRPWSLDGGEEAEWSELEPGCYVLAWFSDDTVWHEMLVTALGEDGLAAVWTPDQDHYALQLQGDPEVGAVALRLLDPSGELPDSIQKKVYRFSHYPSRDWLRSLIRQGAKIYEEEAGQAPRSFRYLLNEKGKQEEVDLFLRRRLRQKTGGREEPLLPAPRTWPEGRDPQLPLLTVGGVEAAVPRVPPSRPGTLTGAGFSDKERGRPQSDTLPQAGPKEVWVTGEPGGGLALGDEIKTALRVITVGSSLAMVEIGGDWVRAELVDREHVADYVNRRRELFGQPLTGSAPAGGEAERMRTKLARGLETPSQNGEKGEGGRRREQRPPDPRRRF